MSLKPGEVRNLNAELMKIGVWYCAKDRTFSGLARNCGRARCGDGYYTIMFAPCAKCGYRPSLIAPPRSMFTNSATKLNIGAVSTRASADISVKCEREAQTANFADEEVERKPDHDHEVGVETAADTEHTAARRRMRYEKYCR